MNSKVLFGVSRVRSLLAVIALTLALFPAAGYCEYFTPGNGATYTLDQLVSLSGEVLTGTGANYQLNDLLFISEEDVLNISPAEETTLAVSGEASLVISGTLQVQGTEAAPVVITGVEQYEGEWGAIWVVGNGSVDMSYAQISFAEDGLYFVNIAPTAPGSVIDHCVIQGCERSGIVLDNYDAPGFTLTNSVVAANGNGGLNMFGVWQTAVTIQGNWFWDNGNSGIYISEGNKNLLIQDNAFTGNLHCGVEAGAGAPNMRVLNNLIYDTDGFGIALNTDMYTYLDELYHVTGGEQAVIHSNVIAGNDEEGIYSYFSSGSSIAYNAIADNAMGVYLENSWNDLIALNSIGVCSLDESLFSLNAMDLPFGYNGTLAETAGGLFDGSDISAYEQAGVFIDNSIPGLGAEPIEYEWIEVNAANADKWQAWDASYYQEYEEEDLDDYPMEEAAIGFEAPFPISYTASTGTGAYTHFSMTSNGLVELAMEQYGTEGLWDYEGRGYFTDYYSGSTILFVNNDDWVDPGEDVYETHNGQQVRMNGFGYRLFQAGDVDGDGKTVPEKCLVLRWYMQHWVDAYYNMTTAPLWNDFQVVLYPDGRIRWNNKASNAHAISYGSYCGLYAGGNCTPFEIMAVNDPQSQTSYLFDPSKARDLTTQIVGNAMINNASGDKHFKAPAPDDPTIGEDGNACLNEAYFVGMRSNTMESDILCLQLNGEGTLSPTIHFNNITSHGDYERRAPLSTWLGVDNNTPFTVDAMYNYWDTDVPASYMDGDVNVASWLDTEVPGPEEAGILLYQPFAVNSGGAVITVTSGTYPGMTLVIPLGAVDDEETQKAAPPGSIVFTMGELLPAPELPSYMEGVGIPFVFTPSGQVFNAPVTIVMPYKGFAAPTHVYYYDPIDLTWKTDGVTVLSVDESKRTVTFTTTHFTVFAAGLSKSAGSGGATPFHYHREEWGEDHFVDCFVNSVGGAGGLPLIPAALAMLLAALSLRGKKN